MLSRVIFVVVALIRTAAFLVIAAIGFTLAMGATLALAAPAAFVVEQVGRAFGLGLSPIQGYLWASIAIAALFALWQVRGLRHRRRQPEGLRFFGRTILARTLGRAGWTASLSATALLLVYIALAVHVLLEPRGFGLDPALLADASRGFARVAAKAGLVAEIFLCVAEQFLKVACMDVFEIYGLSLSDLQAESVAAKTTLLGVRLLLSYAVVSAFFEMLKPRERSA